MFSWKLAKLVEFILERYIYFPRFPQLFCEKDDKICPKKITLREIVFLSILFLKIKIIIFLLKERKFFLIKPRIYIEFSKDGLCQDHFYKAYKLSKCLSNLGEKIFSSNG